MIRHVNFLPDIIPVKGDVQYTIPDLFAWNNFLQFFNNTVRHKYSAWLNTNDHCILKGRMIFQNLVAKSFDGYIKLLLGEYRLQTIFL